MIIQITKQGAESGVHLLQYMKEIYSFCLSNGYKKIDDVEINKVVKLAKFWDENEVPFSEEDQERIRKDYIHTFVGMRSHAKVIYGSDDLKKIIKKIESTIEKLEESKPNLPFGK